MRMCIQIKLMPPYIPTVCPFFSTLLHTTRIGLGILCCIIVRHTEEADAFPQIRCVLCSVDDDTAALVLYNIYHMLALSLSRI